MSALAAMQRRMHDALIRPAADPGAARALFADDGRLDAVAGLAVYQRGYGARIAGCMREQFPALCHALGRALFDDFVAAYVGDRPPERYTLHDLGRRFPEWMAGSRPDAVAPEAWIDFMIALARFEYAVFAMFEAIGNEGRGFADTRTPDDALRLQPAFALGRYDFPVADYYHAVRRDETPSLPVADEQHIALVRMDYVVRTMRLTPVHHAFLTDLVAGTTIATALDGVATRFALDREDVERSWSAPDGSRARWIDWGFFVAA